MQTDATLLANNSQHCWMLHVASICTSCCMLLRKVWNRSNFSANNFQLFQQCWGHAGSLRVVYKDLWVVSFPRCTAGPNIVGSCCIRLHTTANTHATTSNIVGATMLGVVAFARSLTCEKSSIQKCKIGCNILYVILLQGFFPLRIKLLNFLVDSVLNLKQKNHFKRFTFTFPENQPLSTQASQAYVTSVECSWCRVTNV